MEDLISTLPDDAHISILSRLTMREAARTSVLSSKWRYLWVSAFKSRMVFDGDTMMGENYEQIEVQKRMKKFVEAVRHVMQLIKHAVHIKPESFQVCFALDKKHAHYIDVLIDFVISAGVKELHLNLFPFSIILNSRIVKVDFDADERYVFPLSLFSDGKGSSLENLHVQGCLFKSITQKKGCLFKFPPVFLRNLCLEDVVWEDRGLEDLLAACAQLERLSISPAIRTSRDLQPQVKCLNISNMASLKSLSLKEITIDEEDLREILSGCRLLEVLSLSGSKIPDKMDLVHSSVHLKFLEIYSSSNTPKQVVLNGNNLQTFKYWGCLQSINFGNLPKLVNLSLNVNYSCYRSLPYFSKLPNHLCCQLVNLVLNPSLVNLRPSFVPVLSNLKQLRVRVSLKDGDLIRLAYFLEACPMLHDFHVEISQFLGYRQEPEVEKMRRLPECVHYHLKVVKFTGFHGNHTEAEFALYVVSNAIALESMVINPNSKHQMPDGGVVTIGGVPDAWVARRQIIYELLSNDVHPSAKLLLL